MEQVQGLGVILLISEVSAGFLRNVPWAVRSLELKREVLLGVGCAFSS